MTDKNFDAAAPPPEGSYMKLLIKNGRVVHPVADTVLLQDLLVEDGKIAILEHGLSSEADRTIDVEVRIS